MSGRSGRGRGGGGGGGGGRGRSDGGRGGRGRGDGGRGGGRGRGDGGRGDGGRGGRGDGRGGRGGAGGGDGRGGRGRGGGGGGGGGGGRGRGPDLSNINKVLTNILPATLTPHFEFFMYTVDSQDKNNNVIESRFRSVQLFEIGVWNGLLKDMPAKDKAELKRTVFFAGSFFFSSRKIPGLEKEKLPIELLKGDTTEGDHMKIIDVYEYKAPVELGAPTAPDVKKNLNELSLDTVRCSNCTKTFPHVEGLFQHCREKNHRPVYAREEGDVGLVPAPLFVFISYVNLALDRAMGERLLKWGNEYFDPNSATIPKDRNGNELGVSIFEAMSLSFGVIRLENQKPCLALTCDLRAKVKRNKTVLDMIYEERRNPKAQFTKQEQDQLRRKWIGEVVIYKNDRKCYVVTELDFNNSADSLPIPGKGISHTEYFKRKGITLEYPNEKPIVVVEGRRKQPIHFPAELVNGNELDPRVREMLPQVASYTPETRNKAIEKVKDFLAPGKHTSTGGTLLPALGVILQQNRLQATCKVLPAPKIMAAGVEVPKRNAENFAPVLGSCNFNINPREATELTVVVFYNPRLKQGAKKVYDRIRDKVNNYQARYRFKKDPTLVEAGDNERHWGAVEKYFSGKVPANLFVLDFVKPRAQLDTAYPVIKKMLGAGGFLSQFVNFKTYPHDEPRDMRRSEMILGGISRQILQKSGVRLWYSEIPPSLPLPALFVGVDVFHAPMVYDPKAKKRGRKASVAAIIVELIREGKREVVEMYSKTYSREGGEEHSLGDAMKETIMETIRLLKVNPRSVIIWRDGIAETGYMHADEEIRGVRDGLVQAQQSVIGAKASTPKAKTPISYIICQKRIATKLLTTDGKFGAPAGTQVTGIQGMKFQTFYLNGRAPPYSTPKPVRFICVESDLAKVPLAQLTWSQCFAYPNWTGPIKVPNVCQMAHKLAELAGGMVDSGDSIDNAKFKNRPHFL